MSSSAAFVPFAYEWVNLSRTRFSAVLIHLSSQPASQQTWSRRACALGGVLVYLMSTTMEWEPNKMLTHRNPIHLWGVCAAIVAVESLLSQGDARMDWEKVLPITRIHCKLLINMVHCQDDHCKVWCWAGEEKCGVLEDLSNLICVCLTKHTESSCHLP